MQKLIPNNSVFFISTAELDGKPDWVSIFGNDNPIVLEIGCGIGDFLVQMAAIHPEWNFIGLDYYNKGCLKSCKKVEKAGLANVRVVRDEARSFVRNFIAPETLKGVIINCPDPWPKIRHRKRRLVNSEFAAFIYEYLQPGADFYFATDFEDYGEDVAKMMSEQPGFENMLSPQLWTHHLEGYPSSKYMQRFISEGKQIYFVHYRKASVFYR